MTTVSRSFHGIPQTRCSLPRTACLGPIAPARQPWNSPPSAERSGFIKNSRLGCAVAWAPPPGRLEYGRLSTHGLRCTQAAFIIAPGRIELPGMSRKAPKLVYLLGFMGSGKSSVGALLAQELGWPFIDLDSAIESGQGATVREIFEQSGEPFFRGLEQAALARGQQERTCHHCPWRRDVMPRSRTSILFAKQAASPSGLTPLSRNFGSVVPPWTIALCFKTARVLLGFIGSVGLIIGRQNSESIPKGATRKRLSDKSCGLSSISPRKEPLGVVESYAPSGVDGCFPLGSLESDLNCQAAGQP